MQPRGHRDNKITPESSSWRSRVIDMVKRMERCRVIDMGKRFILRNGDAQECAERLPPLLDVEDQQPVWGDRLAHRRIVLGKDGLAMRPIDKTTVEGAVEDDVPRPFGQLVVLQGEDRAADAVVPALRIADGEDDLGVRVRRGQFFPEVGPRPIDDGLKAGQQRPPIDRLAGGLRRRASSQSANRS